MNQQPKHEEIDIIQFFTAFGNMFTGLFRWFFNIFKWLIFILVDAILYVRKHYIVLGTGLLIGLIYAFFTKENISTYYGEAILRTNYNAQLVLQEKVNMLNDFISKQDYDNLGKALNISTKQASNLSNFSLQPVSNDIFLLEDYEAYLIKKDTAVHKFIEYKKYKKNIRNNDDLSRYWKLIITSFSPDTFNHLNQNLINLFNSDSLIEKRKQLYLSFLKIKKQNYLKSLQDIDTMRKVFDKAWLLSNSKAAGQGVNLMLSNEKASVGAPEEAYNLFEERKKSLDNLEKTIRQINLYSDAVVFLNSYPDSGIKQLNVLGNKFIKFGLTGFLLALSVLLLIDFNKFLNKYEQQKNNQTE